MLAFFRGVHSTVGTISAHAPTQDIDVDLRALETLTLNP